MKKIVFFIICIILFTSIFSFVIVRNKYKKREYTDYLNNYSDTLSLINPVGSIYMSITDDTVAKVQARFGGTWEKIESRFLLGSSDSYAVDATGGSADAVLVSHGHTFTGTATNTGNQSTNHTHSVTAKGTNSAPTFTGTATNTGNQSAGHTHSVTGKGSVSSSFSGSSTNTNSTGGHSHTLASGVYNKGAGTTSKLGAYPTWLAADSKSNWTGGSYATGSAGNHSHSVTAKGSVSSSFTGSAVTSGGISANHNHSVTAKGTVSAPTFTGAATNTGNNSANHTHSVTATGTVSTEGSSGTGKNMPPYYVVHIYKRTA